ncbi:MAG: dual specificity protein phosphatase family protein [Chitinophaga sp.]|uniref:phosphatase domain-containing putative toxin n=1 Tax=Chitinophaga sp. TaxID=1869181 RepID=UPI001B108476|nr:dual specificity protein phosphatase family protein [Chitinophaga sp.]MBO9728458.1 dual specificity protein phosphatase family protein [Chitinophaga sp.]
MKTRIYWLEKFPNGASLGIMPRPRGDDWLEDDIRSIKKQGVDVLVCLLEPAEIRELALTMEQVTAIRNGLRFIHFPFPDREAPPTGSYTEKLLRTLEAAIDNGETICIHCRMGIGRSAIIAGSLMLLKGARYDDLLAKISKARGLKVPDTAEQESWLKSRAR